MSILSTSSKLVRVGDSYSAGEGISIENNVISVTGDYGHTYYPGENISISDDNVISSKDWSSDIDTAAQNVSAETTAWVDSQNYLTDEAMSDYALITDVETTSGLLKMDIDTVSGSISGKMDSTAFSNWQNGQYSNDIGGLSNDVNAVSGAVDAISGAVSSLDIPTHQEIIDASGYAYSQSTAWTDSQGYLTQHQDISYLATKDEVSAYTLTTTLEQVSGDIVSQIPSIEGLATKSEVDTVSSFLSGAIDYVSANAGDEFPASANDAITAYQTYSGTYLTAHQSLDGYLTKTSADTLYQPIGNYALENDLEQVSGTLQNEIDYISGVAITAHQDISNKLDTTAFSTVSGTFLTAVDLSNYYTKSETSGAAELADAFANIPAGDADVNSYVQGNSATINDVNTTVQTNSSTWDNGGFTGEVYGISGVSPNVEVYIDQQTLWISAAGGGGGSIPSEVSGKWEDASTCVESNSANWNSAYNDVHTNSSAWNDCVRKTYGKKQRINMGGGNYIDLGLSDYSNIPGIGVNQTTLGQNSLKVKYQNGIINADSNVDIFANDISIELKNNKNNVSSKLTNIALTFNSGADTASLDLYDISALKSASGGGGGGDVDVNNYVYNNSATINDVNTTVQTNSASWTGGGGGSVDTIPVAVISPLVTGFSGESAYLGIESTALNLSSYVPVSAIGVDSNYGWVNKISGRNISAYNAATAQYAYTANRSYKDRNGNEITSYYQPKLTITGDAGTITSINGSAVGASIPEGWELVAGAGIDIVDDAENNQTIISAAGSDLSNYYTKTETSSKIELDNAIGNIETLLASL